MPGMQLVDPNDAAAFEGMRLTVAPDGSYAYLTPIHSPIVSDYSVSDASSGSFSPVPSIYHPQKSPKNVPELGHGDAHPTTGPPPTFGDASHSWPKRNAGDPEMGQQRRISRTENEVTSRGMRRQLREFRAAEFRERAFAERRRRQEAYQRCGKMPELPKPAYVGKGKQRATEAPRQPSEGSKKSKNSLYSDISSRVSRRMKSIFSRSS